MFLTADFARSFTAALRTVRASFFWQRAQGIVRSTPTAAITRLRTTGCAQSSGTT